MLVKPNAWGSFGRKLTVRIIASIEDPVVIRKILAHLDDKAVLVWCIV